MHEQRSDRNIFEYAITVTELHLDELNHVNNVVYVQWMQEAAGKHWNSVSAAATEEQVVWMVRRHEIDYLNQAFSGDVLRMRTWTGDYSAVTWNRHYEIVREADGKKIITAKSAWILLDKITGRPKRLDESILGRFDEKE
jgi:acyl-CoA thioester hydrolase